MSSAILFAKTDAPSGARIAGIPVAGRTVIERQAAIARALGADRLIIMVERMPPDVARAIERLRRDWRAVTVHHDTAGLAGTIAENGDMNGDVIVIRDGTLFTPRAIAEFARAGGGSTVAVRKAHAGDDLSDQKMTDESVAAGLARYPASLLHGALAEVADWDLDLALPRAARESGDLTLFPLPAADAALTVADARRAELWLSGVQGTGRAGRLAMPLTRALARRDVPPAWLIAGSALLLLAGIGLCAAGFLLWGLLMSLAGALVHAAAYPLSYLTLSDERPSWWELLRPGHLEFGVIAAAAASGGAGALAGGAGLAAAIVLDRRQRLLSRAGWRRGRGTVLRLALAAGAFAVTGSAAVALGAALVATAGGLFWRQQQQIGRNSGKE